MSSINTNMPICWQNSLLQYKTEIARKAWVWFAENRGSGCFYGADRYANEVEHLVISLTPMLANAGRAHRADDEVLGDLLRFILVRHANWRLGGNVIPAFLRSEANTQKSTTTEEPQNV